ncbi:putative Polyketide synthase [Seiridium unicorne]|uniref:Polyketide synthase n=1 Tax=Seiridium unicorne TaxID=138068 RepID=A0ABR2UQ61_9PEZI
MAMPRRVPVHFISSPSVAMLQKDTNGLSKVPPSSFWPPADAESLMKKAIGYAASKWVGEILPERVVGVPAVVHRFPNIIGPDAPEEIGEIPLLDIIDVGEVVLEYMAKAYWLSDLTGMYEEKLGTEIDVLLTPEWMRNAKALGMPKGAEAAWTGNEVFVPPVLRKGASDRS